MKIEIDEVRHFEILANRLVKENMKSLQQEEGKSVVKLMEQCFLYGMEFAINHKVGVEL